MILSILKIIGIVILIILAIILLLLGIILLVPIRYRFSGEYLEKLNGEAKLTWIPVLLKACAEIKENEVQYSVRLLGGVIMTNKGEKISWLGRKIFDDEEPKNQHKKQKKQNKQTGSSSNYENEQSELDVILSEAVEEEYNKDNNTASDEEQKGNVTQSKDDKHSQERSNRKKKAKRNKNRKSKIKNKRSIAEKIEQIKSKLQQLMDNLKKINKQREDLLKVYRSPRFGQAKKDVIKYIKSAFRLLKPDRLEGHVLFGTGDPASTGEIFGFLALAIPIYYKFLILVPDFEEKVLEAKLSGKGKLRLISIVILLIKVSLNKNLIKVVKRVQTIMNR